jgi:hypothetical protein
MTANKDFKRLVRGRMRKTGESYTAARAQLLNSRTRSASPASAAESPSPSPAGFARLAGMSDVAIKAKTGCDWEKWVWALDRVKAHDWPHRAIADYVHEKYKVPGWWTQAVTVGYERIKGLRDIGQRRGGKYEASRSRTYPASAARLFRACTDARTRARWLPGVKPQIRTATAGKSVRMTWPDGTLVQLYLTPRSPEKAQLAVQHTGLEDRADVAKRKEYWGERLEALAAMLDRAPRRRSRAGRS